LSQDGVNIFYLFLRLVSDAQDSATRIGQNTCSTHEVALSYPAGSNSPSLPIVQENRSGIELRQPWQYRWLLAFQSFLETSSMPRRSQYYQAEQFYHALIRGHQRQEIFQKSEDGVGLMRALATWFRLTDPSSHAALVRATHCVIRPTLGSGL
jgi:hypothetical protein